MVSDFSLERLIEGNLKEETLIDYFCEKCKKSRSSIKKVLLWKLPDIFVIHLKRFNFTPTRKNKITHNVKSPLNLDMRNFV